LVLGSWRRTLGAGAALVAAFAAVIVVTTKLDDLRHANFPGHPYPPAGFYRNPYPNSEELVNAAEAAKVKADLLQDGQVELQALEHGDSAVVAQADAGNSLARLRQLIDSNNAGGIAEHQAVRIDSIVVGRLQDPNDRQVKWCVEERGSGTITYFAKSNGQTLRRQTVAFDNRFWMVRVGPRYLITDVEVR
jgi:hypothetical protein